MPRKEQFEDAELPMEVRNLCLSVPRKRHGVSFLGSAANTQHCMHVGLGQPAEAPTQTIERVVKALATLQNIERRYGGARHRPHRAVQRTLRRLIE